MTCSGEIGRFLPLCLVEFGTVPESMFFFIVLFWDRGFGFIFLGIGIGFVWGKLESFCIFFVLGVLRERRNRKAEKWKRFPLRIVLWSCFIWFKRKSPSNWVHRRVRQREKEVFDGFWETLVSNVPKNNWAGGFTQGSSHNWREVVCRSSSWTHYSEFETHNNTHVQGIWRRVPSNGSGSTTNNTHKLSA